MTTHTTRTPRAAYRVSQSEIGYIVPMYNRHQRIKPNREHEAVLQKIKLFAKTNPTPTYWQLCTHFSVDDKIALLAMMVHYFAEQQQSTPQYEEATIVG